MDNKNIKKNISDMEIYKKATGAVIRKHRKKHNISQEQLAYSIGVNKSTISRYENGSMDIPASVLPIISKECSFSPSEYALAWMKVKSENIPNDKKEAYIAAVDMIEEISQQIDNLINYDYVSDDYIILNDELSENKKPSDNRWHNYLKYFQKSLHKY